MFVHPKLPMQSVSAYEAPCTSLICADDRFATVRFFKTSFFIISKI